MSKVVVYCRVSSESQEAEGSSLETQERACLAKARELAGPGDEVAVLREVYSGLSMERPELNRLREWVRAGQVKAVVVYSADRLARDGLHLLLLVEEIEKAGAQMVFVTEPHQSTPEGQFLTFARGWSSKLEALKIKERTVRGRKQRNRQGKIAGKGQLYGYLYMKGKGESRGIRLPDKEKAEVVANIFVWLVQEGLSLEKVRKRLYAQGIPSPQGARLWNPSTLLRLLRNPAYIGETLVHWQGETIEVAGATPAIVDTDTWEAAQERLRLNKEMAKRRGKRDYPLRGLLFCGACGSRMRGHYSKGYRRYSCWRADRWVGEGVKPCHNAINAQEIETSIWREIKGVLSQPDIVRHEIGRLQEAHPTEGVENRIGKLQARLRALQTGEGRIARMLRLGEMAEDVATRELRVGRQEREALERELLSLQGQLEASKHWESVDVEALCQRALANFEAPTPEVQRLAFEALGVRIEATRQGIKLTLALPIEQFELRNSC